MSYSSEPLQFSAGQDSMTGGGASMSRAYNKVKGAIKGYRDVTC